ncbi:aldehyde dehydrogenase family protein [Vibrio sp. S4M6]|uniref:aldehyde dehydrogenase family protein n=1 Tax=Vibrio sinus TaxID=2946865 RepID=UPI00202A464A|nr:aldehyde dehydrogenase family protein [Vibrio sinus]MCL9783321.1 aldehyde dehydrogenase family protein [Vibrio sinus]
MAILQKTISPVDGKEYVTRELATEAQVNSVLIQARTAQRSWSKQSLQERQRVCQRALEWLRENQESLGLEICWQMGRPIRYAKNEIMGVLERGEYMIHASDAALSPATVEDKPGFTRFIEKEPIGVVFVVAPWNYPYLTAINSVIPALLAGNSVIIKHSAQTPLCAERLVEAFIQAGLPEGVFQYLHLSHSMAESVIRSGDVNHVAFTGSVKAGQSIEEFASGRFIGVGLELGGKDPAYVRADADLDHAVETVIDGAFFNSGQSCCAIERIYVHHSIYQDFVSRAVELVKQYQLGDPTDMDTTLGPVVNEKSAGLVRDQIKQALEQGARSHIDPAWYEANSNHGVYLAPQLLTGVDHSMKVMTEESFGPVVGIMSVESDEQAMMLMNDSEFGLTASIFTTDIDKAVELGRELQTGTFFVNRCDYLDPALAWTGVKQSGRGHTLSKFGFEAFTQLKSFHVKHP